MVACNGACQAGRDADGEQRGLVGKNREHDGDQDAKGAPAGARGKGQTQGNQEDDGGQKHEQAGSRALHEAGDKDIRAQQGGHVLKGDGKGQNQDGRHHGVEAVDKARGRVLEAHHAASQQVDEGKEQGDEAAPRQGRKGVGIAKRADDIARVGLLVPETAHVEHAHDAADDEHDDGDEHIPQACMRAASGLFIVELAQVAVTVGLELGCGHGAVVKVEEDQAQDEDDDEQRVEVERDGADEQLDAVDAQVLRYAGDGCSPAGDRGDHADGCGGGVDDKGELGA